MMRYCEKTDCPHNKTIITTLIDVGDRTPVAVHICDCKGQVNEGDCLRCGGM